MKRQHIKLFLAWLVFLNWPLLLCWIPLPVVKLFCFLPGLFWINIPGFWFGLAKVIGKPHYDIQEFGVMPLTLLGWILIVAFWVVMAIVLTLVTTFIVGIFKRWLQKR